MFTPNGTSLIDDGKLLNETYLPTRLIGREKQVNDILFCITAASSDEKPINTWVHGAPGTGKTATCKFILRKLEKESVYHGIFINCWEYPTYFSVLDKMVREFRIMGAEKLHSSYKLERLQHHLKNKLLIVFLDEIDQPENKERETILYNFLNMQNVCIIAICNDKHILYGLDERIKSRLNAQWVEFTPYTNEHILEILEDRASIALQKGAYSKLILDQIAKLAEQDARIAIQTLKNAVHIAEKKAAKILLAFHVQHGYMTAKHLKSTFLLHKLTHHHRLLFELIKDRSEILSGELWKLYQKNCKKLKLEPIALRTYSEYINKLTDIGLISSERAMVKGKVRTFKIVV